MEIDFHTMPTWGERRYPAAIGGVIAVQWFWRSNSCWMVESQHLSLLSPTAPPGTGNSRVGWLRYFVNGLGANPDSTSPIWGRR